MKILEQVCEKSFLTIILEFCSSDISDIGDTFSDLWFRIGGRDLWLRIGERDRQIGWRGELARLNKQDCISTIKDDLTKCAIFPMSIFAFFNVSHLQNSVFGSKALMTIFRIDEVL